MTQLDQLESEAAAQRARFADAVDGVRARIGEKADDLRERLSPRRAVRRTGENWRNLIEQRVRDNPIQVASAAALLAYPVWRMARALPLPVLVAGAGVLLSSKARLSTTQATDLLAEARGKAREVGGRLGDATIQARDGAVEGLGTMGVRASETINSASAAIQDTAQSVTANAKAHLAQATDSASAALSNAVDAITPSDETIQSVTDGARAAVDTAGDIARHAARTGTGYSRDAANLVSQNPLLVAGVGIAAGGFLAALLPRTNADSQMLGGLARAIRDSAEDALSVGHQKATRAISDLQHRAAAEAEARGLTAGTIQDAVDDLNEQASDVAIAAKRAFERNAPIRENHHD